MSFAFTLDAWSSSSVNGDFIVPSGLLGCLYIEGLAGYCKEEKAFYAD